MFLICGLGNKGHKYVSTRHNMGYLAVDRFSHRYSIPLDKKICNSTVGIKEDLIIAKPDTYMNISGATVLSLAKRFNIKTEELIIIHDDMDMEFGRIKIRWDGKDGGHRGVRSIIDALETKDFFRLKIGIGRDPVMDPVEYVLSNFRKDETEALHETLDIAAEALYTFVYEGKEKAMSIYNKRQKI
ncbi:MAG TPA: aminoacyl-tRNA hydrolase [Syntrophorhabdaceae bacterium]|nr:aminoacyl-tRNA hydrolase [Syntrophorhabdaceae bacterium]HOL05784.1 aminoacyl-tRNA hydrolase [Syntrophorhabdaceae bacterium]HPP41474.1 aminoacyl-tRNA hydrolase [Syntrophorhabdaceae bacterium]